MTSKYVRRVYRTLDNAVIRARIRASGGVIESSFRGEIVRFQIPTPESWRMICRRLEHETPILNDLADQVENDSDAVFYDVGANIGTYTCLIGPLATSTISIEPLPQNIELLRRNIEINAVDALLYEMALSNENGETTINIPVTKSAGAEQGSIVPERSVHDRVIEQETVPTLKGDDLIEDEHLNPPDVVKIDVEGAAPLVLEGFRGTIEEEHPLFYIEPHGNAEAITSILRTYGYQFRYIQPDREDGEHPTIVAQY